MTGLSPDQIAVLERLLADTRVPQTYAQLDLLREAIPALLAERERHLMALRMARDDVARMAAAGWDSKRDAIGRAAIARIDAALAEGASDCYECSVGHAANRYHALACPLYTEGAPDG